MSVRILTGDCLAMLKTLEAESVHCCVTSPPYFGLRDYGCDEQIGLEPTPDEYVIELVAVFREVRRVLRNDATFWLNIGDSYAAQGGNGTGGNLARINRSYQQRNTRPGYSGTDIKPKDLIGIPWMLAFALRADGWWLRQDIIWHKPNPMPESVTDRCTKAHEYLFLLSKSERYYFDQDAILEPCSQSTHARLSQDVQAQIGSERAHAGGKTNGNMKAVARKMAAPGSGIKNNTSMDAALAIMPAVRNKRSVWTVATQPFSEAHFATFPPALVEPCILAGCPKGGVVCDPFFGGHCRPRR